MARIACATLPVVAVGAGLRGCDRDFNFMSRSWAPGFRHDCDDYLQYAPAVLMVGLKSCGYRGRSSWGRMLVSDALAAATMAAIVNSCKYSVRTLRPDGSTRNSFPSGHTATAFMTATMLAKEYGGRSRWFAVGGYAAATAVGVLRQLNNRHWMSDVVTGAGIGILSTELGYLFAGLIFGQRGVNDFGAAEAGGSYEPSFCGIELGFSTVAGRYAAPDGGRMSFSAAPSARLEGAWFPSKHFGVGGRFAALSSDIRFGAARAGTLECVSAGGGVYFSRPLADRWLVGSKLLAGWERSQRTSLRSGTIGGRCGAFFGTGFSVTCLAGEGVGVRLAADYDLAPAVVSGGGRLHRLTFGAGVLATF